MRLLFFSLVLTNHGCALPFFYRTAFAEQCPAIKTKYSMVSYNISCRSTCLSSNFAVVTVKFSVFARLESPGSSFEDYL